MFATPVVPSNDQISRVLQEQSGNRQHNELACLGPYEAKYPLSSLVGENCYVHEHESSHLQPASDFQRQPLREPFRNRRSCGTDFVRLHYAHFPPEELIRVQDEAEKLLAAFRESPAFVKYRSRQSKENKGHESQKWPEHMEKAFCQALVVWRPMGRRKLLLKQKLRGRNELIADVIEYLTGEPRDRKQVSSHIQVLKPFVENDPYIMKFLSKEDHGMQKGHGQLHSSYGGGRRNSAHPVQSSLQPARPTAHTPQGPDPYSASKLKHEPDVFEPVEFEMFIQQTFKNEAGQHAAEPKRMHTYTRHVDNPRKHDLHLEDWDTIARDFPLLASMSRDGKLDCNVIVAEASLAFPTDSFKDEAGSSIPGIELGISLLCSSGHLPTTPKGCSSQIRCRNTFYESGVVKTFMDNGRLKDERHDCEVRFESTERPGCQHVVDTQVKFGSTFWARTLGNLANRLLNTAKDYREEVAQQIKSTAVVQEIFYGSSKSLERLAVIHWSFRQSTHSNGGTGDVASWRRLVLPAPSSVYDDLLHLGTTLPYQIDPMAKMEVPQDMVFDWQHSQLMGCTAVPESEQVHHPLPTLQPPIEFEGSFSSGPSSATWTGSASESGMAHLASFDTDHTFDFNNYHASDSAYDHNFDSAAFFLDSTGVDLMPDPALESYSQPWQHPTVHASFDSQSNSAMEGTIFIPPHADLDHQAVVYGNDYDSQYSQSSYVPPSQPQYEQPHYEMPAHDSQAYGGAGREVAKDDESIDTLTGMSYLASAFTPRTNSTLNEIDNNGYDAMQTR